jgi:hypothetical protein
MILAPDTLTQLSIVFGPFLNSNFVTSLVGAGAGAWASAYAAQRAARISISAAATWIVFGLVHFPVEPLRDGGRDVT